MYRTPVSSTNIRSIGYDPQLAAGKQVYLFATAGRISSELNELKGNGLKIVDIFDLKEFICWLKESAYKSTKDPVAEAL